MNRNGPCQFQRELPESTFNIFHNLLAFLVQYVFCVCPLLFLQQEGNGAIFGTHFDAVGGKVGDFTYRYSSGARRTSRSLQTSPERLFSAPGVRPWDMNTRETFRQSWHEKHKNVPEAVPVRNC